MADELTDSDDERAVQDVLSQAMDHSVLEQIASINCSTSDNLPSDLETRFRRLKSLPTATSSRRPPSKSKSFTPRSGHQSSSNDRNNSVDFSRPSDLKKCSTFTDDPEEHSDGNRDEKKSTDSKPKLKSSSNSKKFCETKSLKSKTDSSGGSEEYSDGNLDEKSSSNSRKFCESKSLKSKRRGGSSEWRSDSSSESRSVSPPQRGIGCLWCSPKKEKRKQGKENRSWGNEYDVEFLKSFSVKEQKKIMRKAMKEEEKISREAEKIVKWAKQASSRMLDVSGLDDELTDHEK